MSSQKTKTVQCLKGSEVIGTYQFLYVETLGLYSAPNRDTLINEAKFSLTAEGKAFPPYDGIMFEIV